MLGARSNCEIVVVFRFASDRDRRMRGQYVVARGRKVFSSIRAPLLSIRATVSVDRVPEDVVRGREDVVRVPSERLARRAPRSKNQERGQRFLLAERPPLDAEVPEA